MEVFAVLFLFLSLYFCSWVAVSPICRLVSAIQGFSNHKGLFSKSSKQVSNVQNSNDRLERQIPRSRCRCPTTSGVRSGIPNHQYECLLRSHIPERHATKHSEVPRPVSSSSFKTHQDFSGSSSSTSSSIVWDKILHRCIGGEQQMEKSRPNNKSRGNFARNGGGWHPPRVQYRSPFLPTDCIRDKVKAHAFREAKSSCLCFSSEDWASKLDTYKFEEQRLRERVKELAEHNISLQSEVSSLHERDLESGSYGFEVQRLREQARALAENNVSLRREVSAFPERDAESRSKIICFEQQLKDLSKRVEDVNEENQDLKRNLLELQENYKAAEEDHVCLQKNFETKEKECKELHKTVTRLLRTYPDQSKTIDGLREAFAVYLGKNQSIEKCDKLVAKLQMEQVGLTGVELALGRELEPFMLEVDSLLHENIDLQYLFKGNGKESEDFTVTLDKEMWTQVCCLQNQGLAMLNESSKLCSELLEYVKGKACQLSGAIQESEVIKHGLDGCFVVEPEMKVQGLRCGIDNLTRSLQKIFVSLHDKSNIAASISQSKNMDANGIMLSKRPTPEDVMKYELKAETLLTSLMREKPYSKEQEVEQLQAELSTAVRGVNILPCEVQNAVDNLSFVTHTLKDLGLQMLKKDENLNRLQMELQESNKELIELREILPKISAERDLMWEEVKKYEEINMLLSNEVAVLKNKLDYIHEEIDGQITVLKAALLEERNALTF